MLERLIDNAKPTYSARVPAVATVIVGSFGFGLLISKSAVLPAQGVQDFAVCLFAILASSTVSSIAGFAFSAICGAFLFHRMKTPVEAVQVMIVCSIAIQLLSLSGYDRRLLIFYGAYLLLRNRARPLRATGPISDAIAGLLGGLTGGLAGFPGAFVTIWCSLKGWDKARQRGVYQPFILTMQPSLSRWPSSIS